MKYDGYIINKVDNNTIDVQWELGNWCNFRCVYCFDESNIGTHRPPLVDENLIQNVTHLYKEIRSHYPEKHVTWTLSGGEPTAQKKFSKLIECLDTFDNSHVILVTNGSRPLTWWKKNVQYVPHIILSSHPESKIEHNIELVKLLSKNKSVVSISIMIGGQNFSEAVSVFKKYRFTTEEEYTHTQIRFNRIRPTSRNKDFIALTKEQHMLLDKITDDYQKHKKRNRSILPTLGIEARPYRTVTYNENTHTYEWFQNFSNFQGNWIGYDCYAPSHSIFIEWDGTIGNLPCKQRYMDDVNIFDKRFTQQYNLPVTPMVCNKSFKECNCVAAAHAPKVLTKQTEGAIITV